MSDDEFIEFFKRRLPLRFHVEAFKVEPKLNDIVDAFKIINVPLLEKVNLPYMYRNKEGRLSLCPPSYVTYFSFFFRQRSPNPSAALMFIFGFMK